MSSLRATTTQRAVLSRPGHCHRVSPLPPRRSSVCLSVSEFNYIAIVKKRQSVSRRRERYCKVVKDEGALSVRWPMLRLCLWFSVPSSFADYHSVDIHIILYSSSALILPVQHHLKWDRPFLLLLLLLPLLLKSCSTHSLTH